MIGLFAGTIKVNEWVGPPVVPPPAPETPPTVTTPSEPVAPPAGAGSILTPTPTFSLKSFVVTAVDRNVGGTAQLVQVADRVMRRISSATVYKDKQLAVSYTGTPPAPIVYSSSNPAIATVDATGFLTHHATGTVIITASSGASSITITLSLTVDGGQLVVEELADYVPGTLAKHISDAVDLRIAGKSAASALNFFTTQNHNAVPPVYVRNPGMWCADLGSALCSISPWNSTGANTMAGVAISPIHIIFAAHYQIASGATVRFILTDGTVVNRTMTSKLTDPNFSPYWPDITVGVLDSPLPAAIPPVKVLPDDWALRLPSLSNQFTVPGLCLDQEEKALVGDLTLITDKYAFFASPNRVNWEKRAEFYENKIGGDSGNPAFLIINNQLVLINVWTYGGGGSGTNIIARRAIVNQLMAQLGGNFILQNIDLSSFPIP